MRNMFLRPSQCILKFKKKKKKTKQNEAKQRKPLKMNWSIRVWYKIKKDMLHLYSILNQIYVKMKF